MVHGRAEDHSNLARSRIWEHTDASIGAGHSSLSNSMEFGCAPALASTTTASNCLPTAKLPRCSYKL